MDNKISEPIMIKISDEIKHYIHRNVKFTDDFIYINDIPVFDIFTINYLYVALIKYDDDIADTIAFLVANTSLNM